MVHHYLARLDPDGTEPDPTEQRALSIARHTDGSVTGRLELDAVGGEKLQAALESIVQAGRCAGDTRTRGQSLGDTRTRGQSLGDALIQLCDNALASGRLPTLRTVKPHVVVRASISRIVLGPDGAVLDLGRDHLVVTPHLRRAVEQRDRGCVFAGCEAPSHWCDIHHLLEWLYGGETNLANSALLCERHHTKVHHGFRVERQPDGRWRTWRPDGTEIVVHAPLIAA